MDTRMNPPLFSTKLIFGLAVIALGVIMILDNLHLYEADSFLKFWPVLLAALALSHFVRRGPLNVGGHVWLAFSIAGFLSQFGPWGLLDRWWPAFLVWGGILVTLRALFPQACGRKPRTRRGESIPTLLHPDSETPSDSRQP